MDQALAQPHRPTVAIPRRGMVLTAALIATFMAAVESSIIATAMPTIVGDLGGFRLFSWVFAAYLLTMAVTVPIYGRLADHLRPQADLFCRHRHFSGRHDLVRLRAHMVVA